MGALQQHSVWSGYLSETDEEGLEPGDVVIPDDTRYVVVATAANRTLYGRTTAAAGIAIRRGDSTNRAVEIQTVGPCPSSITGLGAGAESDLRVSSTGRLERATLVDGDIFVGKVDADGWAYLNFASAAAAEAQPPGDPLSSVQWNNAGTLDGADNVAVADGDLCVGVNLGTVATWGQIRTAGGGPGGAGWYINMMNGAGTQEIVGLLMYTLDGTGTLMDGDNVISVGHDQDDGTYSFDQAVFGAQKMVGFLLPGVGHDVRFMGRVYSGDGKTIVHVGHGSNWAFCNQGLDGLAHGDTTSTAAWLGGGTGVGYIGECSVAPTTDPTNGVVFYVDLADNHIKWRKEDGTTVVPINTLTNVGSGGALVKTKSGINYDVRSVAATTPLRHTQNTNDVTVDLPGLTSWGSDGQAIRKATGSNAWEWFTPSSGGEANTSSNAGSGIEWANAKVGVDLPFKTFVVEYPLVASVSSDEVQLTLGNLTSWGTAGQSIRVNAGANSFEYYTPATLPSGSNGEFLGYVSGSPDFTNVATYYGGTGTIAAAGLLRAANDFVAVAARNAGNTADLELLTTTSSNDVVVGCDQSTVGHFRAQTGTSKNHIFETDGETRLVLQDDQINCAQPIAGYETGSKPYRLKQTVISISGNKTLSASEYNCPSLWLDGAMGDAAFALVLPDDEGAGFWIYNGAGGPALIKRGSTGASTDCTVARDTLKFVHHMAGAYMVND